MFLDDYYSLISVGDMGVVRNFDWGVCEAPQAPRGVEYGEGAIRQRF